MGVENPTPDMESLNADDREQRKIRVTACIWESLAGNSVSPVGMDAKTLFF